MISDFGFILAANRGASGLGGDRRISAIEFAETRETGARQRSA
jgi:hypothetical protein